ncbi:hypothetical protein [Burkholderia pseudomallei]|uniref:hypothetical protein n=1 Tax=Burkholderia pseudomallei TaxID=28450 RepID=UPI000F07A705|nr:hypothetical protein [Burkholderia pseudomallei]VBF49926.1 lipoprotein [Burkholderia pseudomallei]VBQ49639.1 lipoprotein [Burkholderia pseudomallei]
MKRLLRYLPAIFFAAATSLHAADLPPSITAQLPAGFEPMVFQAGPTVDGKRRTWLVVAHRHDDTADNPSPRPLLIFEETPNGTYTIAARNDNVVFRADEGGQCDPFEDGYNGLAVKGHYFTVQNGVACGQHWTDFITFRYVSERHAWLFDNEIFNSFDPLGGTPDTTHVTRANRAKPVTFEAWPPPR